jgi:hypothetical protein
LDNGGITHLNPNPNPLKYMEKRVQVLKVNSAMLH